MVAIPVYIYFILTDVISVFDYLIGNTCERYKHIIHIYACTTIS